MCLSRLTCTSTVRLSRATARAVAGFRLLASGCGQCRAAGAIATPDVLDEIRAAEDRRRVRAEEGQQLELLEGQHDLAAAGPDPALHVVETDTGNGGTFSGRIGFSRPALLARCLVPFSVPFMAVPFMAVPFMAVPFGRAFMACRVPFMAVPFVVAMA